MLDARLLRAVLGRLRRLRGAERWTRAQLQAHQDEALQSLREWAYARSPFYQDFHRGLQRAPLEALPVLTKGTMMAQFDTFVTDHDLQLADVRAYLTDEHTDRFHGEYEVITTSGSTGQPGVFLFHADEWATIIASFARSREWAGLRLNPLRRSRMAVVASTNERHVSARVGRVADTPFMPTLRLDAIRPLPEIVAALNGWQPEVLVAYASMAYFLAAEQAKRALSIQPHVVFTSSEVLTAQMRERLVEVWGNVVFDEYASTETASIAAEDIHHHGLHLFEDLLIVENVDAQNQPVPPGTFGAKLLVTVLFSRTQPLIRYEISDSVRFAANPPSCRLPFRTIDGVQGRQEDFVVLTGENGQPVQIHPRLFHDVMDLLPNNGWQVLQEPDALRVLVVPSPVPLQEAQLQARLGQAMRDQGVLPPTVLVQRVDGIPRAASGKTPLIKAHRSVVGA